VLNLTLRPVHYFAECSFVNNTPCVKAVQAITVFNCAQTVRHNDYRLIALQSLHCLHHAMLGFRIKRARGFVKHQH
jgi:hypothetical protein